MATSSELSSVGSSSSTSEQQMTIYVNFVCKFVGLKMKKSDKIRDLKASFCKRVGMTGTLLEVFLSGKRLNDEQSLTDCGIQEHSIVDLYVKKSEVIKIFITITYRKTVEIEAEFKETIEAIKSKICLKEGTNLPNQFSLYYAGTPLRNSRTLASLGITENSALFDLAPDLRDSLLVSFELPNGNILKTEVRLLFTIAEVKSFVSSIARTSLKDEYVWREEELLDDSRMLAYYELEEDDVLRIGARMIQLFVYGCRINTSIFVQENENIGSLKKKILRKAGYNLADNCYILRHRRENLDENRDLASYSIGNRSKLDLGINSEKLRVQCSLSDLSDRADITQLRPITTIADLKRWIPNHLGMSVKKIDINGRFLSDRRTLFDYKIDESTLLGIHYREY